MMQAATITIAAIHPSEGKGPGYIQDTAGVAWKLWPDKHPQFIDKIGQTVIINFKSEEYRGKTQYTVLGLAGTVTGLPPRRPPPPQAAPAPPAGSVSQVEQNDRIAILALVKGVPEFGVAASNGDVQRGIQILRTLRAIWHGFTRPNGPAPKPSLREELNDDLPTFDEPTKNIEDTF